MPAQLWTIADDLCGAGDVLIAEYEALAAAERDYRDRCRSQRRQMQIQPSRSTYIGKLDEQNLKALICKYSLLNREPEELAKIEVTVFYGIQECCPLDVATGKCGTGGDFAVTSEDAPVHIANFYALFT